MIPPTFPLIVIDPSSTKIGWALLGQGPRYIASGAYYCPGGFPPDERVLTVGPGINYIIQNCRERQLNPAMAVMEIPDFVAQYAKAHIVVYWRAVGVAEYAMHLLGIPFVRVSASEATRKARKATSKDRFRAIVGSHPIEDDESDAVVIGWEYLTRNGNPATR